MREEEKTWVQHFRTKSFDKSSHEGQTASQPKLGVGTVDRAPAPEGGGRRGAAAAARYCCRQCAAAAATLCSQHTSLPINLYKFNSALSVQGSMLYVQRFYAFLISHKKPATVGSQCRPCLPALPAQVAGRWKLHTCTQERPLSTLRHTRRQSRLLPSLQGS